MTAHVARSALALFAVLALTSCGREVPLRIGPLGLVMGLSQMEVRVWTDAACPLGVQAAADPATLNRVAVDRFYAGTTGASSVGAVPAGAHAVSVLARGPDCAVILYGCTPNVDFATAAAVNVTWAMVPPGLACEAGLTCDSGACTSAPGADAATTGDAG